MSDTSSICFISSRNPYPDLSVIHFPHLFNIALFHFDERLAGRLLKEDIICLNIHFGKRLLQEDTSCHTAFSTG
ncbi:hypothetical protein BSONL12_21804 [Bacillus sonorensis L12]|uniref:Uncharacterized protein n=1 Tax=Bacillus sonorensis L12 TaxID=1274524 RepID=M5PB16_9BACI|nr:hypothetical protein BSONL12_21804 [Bacillus sonorensis L12]